MTQWKISALSVLDMSRAVLEPDLELRGEGMGGLVDTQTDLFI